MVVSPLTGRPFSITVMTVHPAGEPPNFCICEVRYGS